MSEESEKIVILTGPTATGKTALAVRIAQNCNGEIVSADSRQVYRGLDLGSGKDLVEYEDVPHHLIDVAEPADEYHLARFLSEARAAIRDIAARGKLPVVAGGTALYLHALLGNYTLPGQPPDPEERARLDALPTEELTAELRRLGPPEDFHDWDNRKRIRRAIEIVTASGRTSGGQPNPAAYQSLLLGVYRPRPEVHRRIEERLDARFAAGMIEEVRQLHDSGRADWPRLESFGLEYRDIALHLQGKLDFPAMRATLLAHIRQFAKRQDIWFRKLEREGHPIHWLTDDMAERAQALIADFLADRPLPAPAFRMLDTVYGKRTNQP